VSTPPPFEPPPPGGGLVPLGPPAPSGGQGPLHLPPRPDQEASLRPRATWRAWQPILIYIGVLLVVASVIVAVGDALIPNANTALLVENILIDLSLLGLLVLWLRWRHPTWAKVVGWPVQGTRLREAGAGAARGALLYAVANFGVGIALYALIGALIGHPPGQPDQLPEHLTTLGTVCAVLFAVVVAPVTEEFFFRGCVFRALRDRHGFWIGALGSAALFGLVHIPLHGTIAQTLLLQGVMVFTGFGFAFIYERRGNLLASIAAHMAFNALGMMLILWTR
jgi:CAAX protease family protein